MFEEDEETPAVSKKKRASKKKSSAKKTEEPKMESLQDKSHFVDLPSSGLLGYPQTVEYRDMYMRDEKNLSMASEENYFMTLNKVLKSIMKNPDWYNDMAIHDRDYMLVWVWANNYGTKKDLVFRCPEPECQHDNRVTVDLTSLDVIDIDPEINDYTPFEIALRCGTRIWVNVRTVTHELATEKFMKNNTEAADIVQAFFMSTVDIEGMEDADLVDKVRFAEDNILVNEMAMIRAFHEHIQFGTNDQYTRACSACGEESTHTIPFRVEDFLQSSLPDEFGELLRTNKNAANKSS